jgi:hypothetical protein
MAIKATEVRVTAKYVCPMTDKEVVLNLKPSELYCSSISSIYDDVDSGVAWELSWHKCPSCEQTHPITIYEDRPFGG